MASSADVQFLAWLECGLTLLFLGPEQPTKSVDNNRATNKIKHPISKRKNRHNITSKKWPPPPRHALTKKRLKKRLKKIKFNRYQSVCALGRKKKERANTTKNPSGVTRRSSLRFFESEEASWSDVLCFSDLCLLFRTRCCGCCCHVYKENNKKQIWSLVNQCPITNEQILFFFAPPNAAKNTKKHSQSVFLFFFDGAFWFGFNRDSSVTRVTHSKERKPKQTQSNQTVHQTTLSGHKTFRLSFSFVMFLLHISPHLSHAPTHMFFFPFFFFGFPPQSPPADLVMSKTDVVCYFFFTWDTC